MARRKQGSPCLVCGDKPGREVTVLMHRTGYSDGWIIRVCEDDLKVFETMLDTASTGRQWGFPSPDLSAGQRVFF